MLRGMKQFDLLASHQFSCLVATRSGVYAFTIKQLNSSVEDANEAFFQCEETVRIPFQARGIDVSNEGHAMPVVGVHAHTKSRDTDLKAKSLQPGAVLFDL